MLNFLSEIKEHYEKINATSFVDKIEGQFSAHAKSSNSGK